ncbi:hypothetical protein Dcar01_01851 [Deinococcus carri]|uniref:Helicase ATP-binding domain-containing protein n=1 Tax=Deinococcus carri TaxID=1211323 RepID=A0ABP9W9G3_9DEIO
MTIELKTYQQEALDAFSMFLSLTRSGGSPADAFHQTRAHFKAPALTYVEAPGLPGVPYGCIRIPTGGGKTLVAARAVGIAASEYLQLDHTTVVWLAPTDQIVSQTLRALRNRQHPYRQALEAAVGGRPVEVLDLAEALSVTKATLDSATTVIVSTLAALRVDNEGTRKVYESAGALMHHFGGLPREQQQELQRADGTVAYSLTNVLRLHRPFVIVDEAHNAGTKLSFKTLERFRPSCILELTATPSLKHDPQKEEYGSNVFYTVSAFQLKAEGMIKLPVRLQTHPSWQTIVGRALKLRDRLEQDAARERGLTSEQIRPIILYQAQANDAQQATLTPEFLRHELVNRFGVPEEQIKVATGNVKELDGIDLMDPGSPVRHVITVQALREGWDCPFAYVLCSVAELRSKTAVEQFVGRVLRLPKAQPKQVRSLNLAYVLVTSDNFAKTLRQLSDGLVQGGFSKYEGKRAMEAGGLFDEPAIEPGAPGQTPSLGPIFVPNLEELDGDPSVVLTGGLDPAKLTGALAQKVDYDPATRRVTIRAKTLNEAETEQLQAAAADTDDQAVLESVHRFLEAPPSERGVPFRVPWLTVRLQGEAQPVLFDDSVLIDRGWKLTDHPAELTEQEYTLTPRPVASGIIDVTEKGKVEEHRDDGVDTLQELRLQFDHTTVASEVDLVVWLDQSFRHEDVTSTASTLWLRRLVRFLTEVRGAKLEDLAYDRFRLRDAVKAKVDGYRKVAKKLNHQALLFERPEDVLVGADAVFSYGVQYPASRLYEGPHQFSRHYYGLPGDLEPGKEEEAVAIALDGMPEVRHWVRNIARQPRHSFWFQTSTDKAYPDFVVELNDGRVIALEYKGDHLRGNPDTVEKEDIGKLWEARGGGQVKFLMLFKEALPRLRELLLA